MNADSALRPHPHAHVHALYRGHHGWLLGWLRGRLGNSFDAADLALLLVRSAVAPHPRQPGQPAQAAAQAAGLELEVLEIDSLMARVVRDPRAVYTPNLLSRSICSRGKPRLGTHDPR